MRWCPMPPPTDSHADFGHSAALIERARHSTAVWLESGNYRGSAWPLSSSWHAAAA